MTTPSPLHKLTQLQKRLFASRFFTVSVLLHFILVMTLGTVTLIKVADRASDFTVGGEDSEGAGFVANDPQEEALPPEAVAQPIVQGSAPVEVASPALGGEASGIEVIVAAGVSNQAVLPSFGGMAPTVMMQPYGDSTGVPNPQGFTPKVGEGFGSLTRAQQEEIRIFTGGWAQNRPGSGRPGDDPKRREFIFTAYLAKYQGGDWASTNQVKDGEIIRGSLPNLLYMISRHSEGRIKANPHAVPLDLSSDEIFAVRPPFIFFTGHRDFVLTEKEVENLRKYVMLGGCIWGDSSLPGHRSRFDIAFRREMRRVIPDIDRDWEVLPARHALYTRRANLYHREITAPPAGMNHYAEPVYALKFAGEVAVVYTANDYGDMWQVGMTPDWKFDTSRDKNGQYVAMNGQIWSLRDVYFRNVTEKSVADTYKFGTNLVVHLLTRWEDHVRAIPAGL